MLTYDIDTHYRESPVRAAVHAQRANSIVAQYIKSSLPAKELLNGIYNTC